MTSFNYCLITASNPNHAAICQSMLDRRVANGLYPREVVFRVSSDPARGRVGSGGGTLLALLNLLRDEGVSLQESSTFFREKRILVINAGGESRRLPLYAPEGKLFAPLPLASSSVFPPIILDALLSLFFRYAWGSGEVLVSSGDVVLDFDTELVRPQENGIRAFAAPASYAKGSLHGVFKFNPVGETILDFFQKAPEDFLRQHASIEGTDECAIDMGLISMGADVASAFVGLAERRGKGTTFQDALEAGLLSFDLYLEILTASLPGLSFADFEKRIRKNTGLSKLEFAEVYAIFSRFPLSGVMTRSSSFIHFGSLQEFSAACLAASRKGLKPFYSLPEEELIPEVEQRRIVYNSGTLEAEGSLLFAENCDGVRVVSEGPLMIAGVRDWVPGEPLPGGLCIEQRSVGGRRVMVVFGIGDDFGRSLSLHDLHYCGVPMPRWLNERNLDAADLWDSGTTRDLSSARLFACDGSEDLVRGLWRKLDDGVEWAVRFRSARRYSISELDSESSATERDQARVVLRTRALRERLLSGRGFRSISAIDFSAAVTNVTNLSSLKSMFNHTDDPLLRSYRQRLLAKADPNFGRTEERISIDFARGRQTTKPLEIRVKHDQIVWARCPVRLDLAGGWSDTPPYTNRFGGEVLNVAVDLNGQSPIQVFVRRTRERFIKLHSIDLGVTETIADTRILQDYRDPSSPFSLPKAVLCLFGLDAAGAGGLDASLGALGGGLELTLLCAVPKGSGLGTSSILAGTILAALARFFGMTVTKDELFLQVLEVEQMLTTGGGWQDQIGGMIGGVKFSESRPGLWPSPLVYQLDPFLFENDQYRSTMTLFYTGITRLAKNILQEVVERVNELSRSYLFTHHCIKELARFGREAISLRDLGRLARVISMSWQENVLIHESTTNQEIEAMVSRTSSYFRGMKLLGAGGGGFALFVSESPAHADELRQVLRRDFENDRARLVDFQLNKTGLEVTVS